MKCNNKECKNDFCESPLNHLNRINGQIEKIKKYIEGGQNCKDTAILLKSVSNSFESARQNIFKNFILNEINNNKKLTKKEIKNIEDIFNSFKK